VTELERDFTFSLTKYPSLIFVFLLVIVKSTIEEKETLIDEQPALAQLPLYCDNRRCSQ